MLLVLGLLHFRILFIEKSEIETFLAWFTTNLRVFMFLLNSWKLFWSWSIHPLFFRIPLMHFFIAFFNASWISRVDFLWLLDFHFNHLFILEINLLKQLFQLFLLITKVLYWRTAIWLLCICSLLTIQDRVLVHFSISQVDLRSKGWSFDYKRHQLALIKDFILLAFIFLFEIKINLLQNLLKGFIIYFCVFSRFSNCFADFVMIDC